jgi:hypothetical protein
LVGLDKDGVVILVHLFDHLLEDAADLIFRVFQLLDSLKTKQNKIVIYKPHLKISDQNLMKSTIWVHSYVEGYILL